MCRVKTCCCGCTLQTGAITCCVFTGIAAVYNFISGAQTLQELSTYKENGPPDWWNKDDDWEGFLKVLSGMGGFILFSGILSAVAFVFILIGIVSKQAGCIMVWLVIEMLHIVCAVIVAIIFFATGSVFMVVGISFLIGDLLSIYLWIVVKSYYHELNEGEGGQQSMSDPKGVV